MLSRTAGRSAASQRSPATQGSAQAIPSTARGPGADDLLRKYTALLSDTRTGQRAIRFHLSRLQPVHRRDKHIQIATNMLEELVVQFAGRIFALANADVVVICKGIPKKVIDDAVELLRYLFNDDPLMKLGAGEGEFFSVYDLQVHYDAFVATLQTQHREAEATKATARADTVTVDLLDPAQLGALLDTVSQTDLSSMVRRQTIWEMARDRTPRPMFDELFISIDRLREALGKGFDLGSDRQLFQYLTRWLDKYVLSTLVRDHSDVSRPISINVNLATLLSSEFRKFEGRRPVGWRDRLMLEMQLADMWLDLPAFLSVARHLKENGYLRCLDGVIHNALPYLNFRRLDIEFVKVMWDDALLQLDQAALRDFCEAIGSCGTQRIILTRCGRPEAIKFGQAIGIQLFQGRCIDQAAQGR